MPPEPLRILPFVEKPHEHVDDLVDGPDADVARLLVLVRDVLGDFRQRYFPEFRADDEGLDAAHAPPQDVLDLLLLRKRIGGERGRESRERRGEFRRKKERRNPKRKKLFFYLWVRVVDVLLGALVPRGIPVHRIKPSLFGEELLFQLGDHRRAQITMRPRAEQITHRQINHPAVAPVPARVDPADPGPLGVREQPGLRGHRVDPGPGITAQDGEPEFTPARHGRRAAAVPYPLPRPRAPLVVRLQS